LQAPNSLDRDHSGRIRARTVASQGRPKRLIVKPFNLFQILLQPRQRTFTVKLKNCALEIQSFASKRRDTLAQTGIEAHLPTQTIQKPLQTALDVSFGQVMWPPKSIGKILRADHLHLSLPLSRQMAQRPPIASDQVKSG